jgi:hypothetical protein
MSFGDIVTDIFGHVPVVGVVKVAIQQVFKRRLAAAREILLEEMKCGDKDIFDAAELEEVAAIIYRYGRAAQEGAARINLRLLAQVMAGQRHAGVLKADEFLYYADILSSLRMEEIILLGSLVKHIKIHIGSGDKDSDKAAWMATQDAEKELIPSVFSTKEDFNACCASILRTGLLAVGSGFGALIYKGTSLLEKLCHWASFEEAFAKESGNNTSTPEDEDDNG